MFKRNKKKDSIDVVSVMTPPGIKKYQNYL